MHISITKTLIDIIYKLFHMMLLNAERQNTDLIVFDKIAILLYILKHDNLIDVSDIDVVT